MTAVEAIQHQNYKPLSDIFSTDMVTSEFSAWFEGVLKGGSRVRLKNSREVLNEFLLADIKNLIGFLEKFTQKPAVCGLVHEMGEKVIFLVDNSSIKLTQFNCPMQESNPICGHPELSHLAHAIFLAEKVLDSFAYRAGSRIVRDIIELDELVGSLPNSGRDKKQTIIDSQRGLILPTTEYISKLIGALKEKYC